MPEPTLPPPVLPETPTPAPPVFSSPVPQYERPQIQQPRTWLQRAWAGFVAAVVAFWKIVLPILKLSGVGAKLLLTASTMLVSMWFYALLFGWKFAAGFVIGIFIHEMGHVFFAWTLGIPVSAPIFIPGMGALILQKRSGGSAWNNALIGIGGPLFGGLASAGAYGFYLATGNRLFLGLAMVGFLINLFNMIPMYPLDGGWITGAVSPYIWILGMVALLGMAITGHLHNPFIYLIIILSLPRLVDVFRRRTMDQPGTYTTPTQKVVMGLSYVGLCAFLAIGLGISGLSDAQERSNASPQLSPTGRTSTSIASNFSNIADS